jgi:hypothetical protein
MQECNVQSKIEWHIPSEFFFFILKYIAAARGRVVGWGTMLQAWKVAGSNPDEVIEFFNWPNPSSPTMA